MLHGFDERTDEYEYSSVPVLNVNISLRHAVQQDYWDCGLSCVAMVLPEKKLSYFNANKEDITAEEGIEFSTWTIDLAYLLKRFNVIFKYFTTMPGICPVYYQHRYYTTVLPNDENRVMKKFENARRHGIKINVRSLHVSTLIHHLSDFGPIIVLTNANLLTCNVCTKKKNEWNPLAAFQGHYVVLIGYSFSTNHILYKNPSRKHGTCRMSFAQLDKARNSFGTDDDVILIYALFQRNDVNDLCCTTRWVTFNFHLSAS